MQWLANVSVRRPVFAAVLMLLIVVVGGTGWFSLGVDRFPRVDFPFVTVTTRLPGAAPEEIETEVTDKIEEAVNTISGIDELMSTSSEGVSIVSIKFDLDKDVDVASQEVRDKVSAVIGDLPKDIDQPVVMKMDPDATPVLYLIVKADRSVKEITDVADNQVRPKIENVSGVGQISLVGGRKREIHVLVDPLRLRAAALTVADVQRAISMQNLTTPGGSIETGPEDLTLRVRGRVGNVAEIGRIVVKTKDGHPIRVDDVATIADDVEDAETAGAYNGVPAILLSIRKQSGSNTVEVVDAVRARLAELQPNLPAGYSVEVVRDNSLTIRTSVHAVGEHLLIGGILAAVVVLLFLANVRSTAIAAIAIPISIIGTFALMWIQGFTQNTITLLALALAVGIVIDDAIVVLENVVRWIDEKGIKPFPAAILATKEIGLAVLATTLSLIAVFLPVAFMGGIVGRFLKSFGLTMAFSIGVSLIVSFSLTPMLSARWLKPHRASLGPDGKPKKSVLSRLVDAWYEPVEKLYVVILAWVMRHRWTVVLASVAALAAIVPLGMMVPKGFLPKSDEAQFQIELRAPEGTSLTATEIAAERLAREVREVPGVTATLTTIGDNQQKTQNLATVFVKLTNPEERKVTQDQLMDVVRRQIVAKQPEEMRVQVQDVPIFDGGGARKNVQYEITGPDLDQLYGYASTAAAKLKEFPGAVDVDTSIVAGKPELTVSIERSKAADLGVQVSDIAQTLRVLVDGEKVSTFADEGKEHDIRVRAGEKYRIGEEALALLSVPSSRLGSVPLVDVVKIDRGEGPGEIKRQGRRRQVLLSANAAPGTGVNEVNDRLVQIMKDLNMPQSFAVAPQGESKEMGSAARNFLIAFALAFVFMYLVLAAQFESWLHPITILITLPLTLPFALVSLLIFGQALDIYSALGILVLFGVVKKNAILQIDHTNHLRAKGMDRLAAILEANRDRLRPILMTTIAFVAGMIPLVFSKGIGAGFNQATAGVVVGGQTLSLLLTLLATPVVYSLFDDAASWIKARFGKKASAEAADDGGEAELDALLAAAEGHQ